MIGNSDNPICQGKHRKQTSVLIHSLCPISTSISAMRALLLEKNIGPERVKSPPEYWKEGSVRSFSPGVLETLCVKYLWPKHSHEFFWHLRETSWRSNPIPVQMLLPIEKHLPHWSYMCCAGAGSPDSLQHYTELRIGICLPPSLAVLRFS